MTARLQGNGQDMIAPQNMACAHVFLSGLSPRQLPPNALEQLQKKNIASNSKEHASSGCITRPNCKPSFFIEQCDNFSVESNWETSTLTAKTDSHYGRNKLENVQKSDVRGGSIATASCAVQLLPCVEENTFFVSASNFPPHVHPSNDYVLDSSNTVCRHVPDQSVNSHISTAGCDAMGRSRQNHTLTVHQIISGSHSAKFSRDTATHYVGQQCCVNSSLLANSIGKEAVDSEAGKEESETLSLKLHDVRDNVDMNARSCKYKKALVNAKNLCCSNDDAESVVSTSLSASTFDSSNFIADDRSSEVSDDMVMNYSPGLSSSYSPPESPNTSLMDRNPSEEREILQLPGNMELVETGIAKGKGNHVVPCAAQVLHVESDTQSRNGQSSPNIALSKLMHSKTFDVRHLSARIPELQIPEVKLVPLKIKDDINHNRDNGAHLYKAYGSREIHRRLTCSLEKKLVVQIVDIGDKLKLSSRGGYKLQRFTKDSLLVYKKNNIKKKEVVKQSQKRKREPKEKKVRKYRIPKQYENTKFCEIQTISRTRTRYKVAFAKWPQVFTQALDLINQRIASQNALSFFLNREEREGTA